MRPADHVMERVSAGKIIAILRGDFRGLEDAIAAVLLESGLAAMEVTLNSPGAFDSIRRLSEQFGTRLAIGAGTVLQPDDVGRVADAGGQFVVSPNGNPLVIRETKRRGLASFPGCFTPSEIVAALEAGADAAKVFPAQCLGIGFIKAIRGPFPTVRLIPTGGVTAEAAREYWAVGAWAVGVGSELLGRDVSSDAGLVELRRRALNYAAEVRASEKGAPRD